MSEESSKSLAVDVLDTLSPRAQKFLLAVADGGDVYESYKLAGYSGEPHAAYVLKGRMDKQLSTILEARGLNRSSWMMEVKKLNDMPLVDFKGNPVKGITVKEKISLLAMQQRELESRKPTGPTVRFEIGKVEAVVQAPKIIEAEQVRDVPTDN